MKYLFSILFFLGIVLTSAAQPTQTIRGTVINDATHTPIPYASVAVLATTPLLGVLTDSLGNFTLSNVPVGRYTLSVSCVGYEPVLLRETVVSSAKQTFLFIQLKETSQLLAEVEVRPKVNKELPLNPMATVSARMLSVEEAKRYAGGFDDPSRLASSFAGVAGNTDDNGIIVRGNAPKFLQWKMEGIEIPNPNHFGDLKSFGGGSLTALSSQMLANSDFFTGAFPAEYNNALSGVFDVSMRKGNNQKHEHTFQAGVIGIDASSEGPFKKGGKASYLFNYRYSTLALLTPILPENVGGLKFQDFSFKLNFPTKRAGTFSVWGIGLADKTGAKAKTDSTQWKYDDDREQNDIEQYMGAVGVKHTLVLKNSAYLQTTLAATTTGTDWRTQRLTSALALVPKSNISVANATFVLSSFINKAFGTKHTNKTGVLLTGMQYDLALAKAQGGNDAPLKSLVDARGFSTLLSAYSSSSFQLSRSLSMNVGINSQFFSLNKHVTLEPRVGFRYQWKPTHSVGVAYGLHSRLERLNYYFNNSLATGETAVNKNLDFTKAHHLVLSYDWAISDVAHLRMEPYYQSLFSVPVMAGSSFSLLNVQNDWFFAEKLQNTGAGRNYGVDITLEKYLSKGYYYLLTGSLFSSEYKGGDGVWRNTRFNRNFVANVLFGKEWQLGNEHQNVLSLNARVTYQGGNRYSPVNQAASEIAKQVVFDETKAFSMQVAPALNVHFTASYKLNKRKSSREIALKILNLTSQPDFNGFRYNLQTRAVEKDLNPIVIPNLSYKIEF